MQCYSTYWTPPRSTSHAPSRFTRVTEQRRENQTESWLRKKKGWTFHPLTINKHHRDSGLLMIHLKPSIYGWTNFELFSLPTTSSNWVRSAVNPSQVAKSITEQHTCQVTLDTHAHTLIPDYSLAVTFWKCWGKTEWEQGVRTNTI